MNFKLLGLAASLVLFSAVPSQAVPLVDQGNNTFDPNTGLQWLDVTLSGNRSYIDVSAQLGLGGDFQGYRYATAAEVSTLYTNAGITNPYDGPLTGESPRYAALISLLGGSLQVSGILADTSPFAFFQRGAVLALYPNFNFMQAATDCCSFSQSSSNPAFGSFLVTDAVATPLPAALPLFATGLGVMGLLGWRRKRKAALAA